MKKILIPTDFSANSKSGIRFAIWWATLQKMELTFVHVLDIVRPTTWTERYFEKFTQEKQRACRIKFENFIAGIYREMNVKAGKTSQVILKGISADITILDYCRKNLDIDCICISTRGAGKFKKIFGSNTGNLITKSNVPVLAIPKNYRMKDCEHIMYATDFRDYEAELEKVVAFAKPLKAKIEMLHFSWPDEIIFDTNLLEKTFKKKFNYNLQLLFKKNDAVNSLVENLQREIRIRKPSLVIMFTNQERTLFERLFLSSKSEELSFSIKVPLLVFNKNDCKR